MQFFIFGSTSWKRLGNRLAHDAQKTRHPIQSDSIAEDWYESAQGRLVLESSDWYDVLSVQPFCNSKQSRFLTFLQ